MKFTPKILIILLLLMSGCQLQGDRNKTAIANPDRTTVAPKAKSYTKEAKLVAVGDLLMHMALIKSGYNTEKKSYNFDQFFTLAKPIISSADLAIANLEVPVAGPDFGYSEFPIFNAPAEIVDAAKNAGFDILTNANNHSHPHVVQPYQIFKVRGKDGKIRTRVAIYSMGNFIAYQLGNYKDLGVIFGVNIRKRFPDKSIEITKVEAIPTYTQNYQLNNKLNFRVLPIEAVVKAKKDPLIPNSKYPVLKQQLNEMNKHLKSIGVCQLPEGKGDCK